MSRVVFLEERCKGCLLCTTVCPKNILRKSDRFNHQGYQVVEAGDNAGECTGCAACAVICPDVAIRVFRTRKARDGQGGDA